MFSSSAICGASSVGADFEMTIDTPIFAAFNKTSEEIRPLKTISLSRTGIPFFKQLTVQLIERVVAPDVRPHEEHLFRIAQRRIMDAARFLECAASALHLLHEVKTRLRSYGNAAHGGFGRFYILLKVKMAAFPAKMNR